MVRANLAEAYVDSDLDMNGEMERVFQLPDCIAVMIEGEGRWDVPAIEFRAMPDDFNTASLVQTTHNGQRVLEVRYGRDSPRTREVYRYRWDGTRLLPVLR
jgi:hypothetical protein